MKTHIYYIAIIVTLLALGLWGRQANHAALVERDARIAALQSDLTLCLADVKAQGAALAGLRGQNNAGQDNCAAALAAMGLISEISRVTSTPNPPRHAGGAAATSPALATPPASTANTDTTVNDDAAFTDFLNSF